MRLFPSSVLIRIIGIYITAMSTILVYNYYKGNVEGVERKTRQEHMDKMLEFRDSFPRSLTQ